MHHTASMLGRCFQRSKLVIDSHLAEWAAAIGSFFVGIVAICVAFIPVYNEHWAKKSEARVIAGAIAEEIEFARVNATIIAQEIKGRSQRGSRELIELIPSILLRRTTMIDRFLAELSCFGAKDGKIVADACAAILNLNAQLSSVGAWPHDPGADQSFDDIQHLLLSGLISYADNTAKLAQAAKDVLRYHGAAFLTEGRYSADAELTARKAFIGL